MNKKAYIPAIIAFLLPFLNELIVFAGSGQMDKVFNAPLGLLGNAVFAMSPFLLIGSVMRPRPSVTRALWIALIMTILIWVAYAVTGLGLQTSDEGMALNFYIFMAVMVWPFFAAILMGIIAKFREPHTTGDENV